MTYSGWPLYYYTLDKQAGDINGQGIYNFGGFWWLMNSNGRPLTDRLYNTTFINNPMVNPVNTGANSNTRPGGTSSTGTNRGATPSS